MSQTVLRPKKSLGQHFLRDKNIAAKIVAQLNPQPGDLVLEIGPGRGALTGMLAESGAEVVAVDIDIRTIESQDMRELDHNYANLHLSHSDILHFDPASIGASEKRPLRIIGNIPYNITSPILFRLFEWHPMLKDCVLMMQREVAQRLTASPHSKAYGILSVLVQLHFTSDKTFRVSPTVFFPQPGVWSTVIHLNRRIDLLPDIGNYAFFIKLVKRTFGQRRKMLSNSLRSAGIPTDFLPDEMQEQLRKRPEELSIREFIQLARQLDTNE